MVHPACRHAEHCSSLGSPPTRYRQRRIGGTVYSGDQLDCVVLNETSLWSGGANTPENGNTIIMRGTLANGEVFEGRILVRTRGGAPCGFTPADSTCT